MAGDILRMRQRRQGARCRVRSAHEHERGGNDWLGEGFHFAWSVFQQTDQRTNSAERISSYSKILARNPRLARLILEKNHKVENRGVLTKEEARRGAETQRGNDVERKRGRGRGILADILGSSAPPREHPPENPGPGPEGRVSPWRRSAGLRFRCRIPAAGKLRGCRRCQDRGSGSRSPLSRRRRRSG